MTNLDVNAVNSAQVTTVGGGKQEQENSKIVDNVPVGQGYGVALPNGEQEQKLENAYGKDIANFASFKGNDKNDAMRLTATVFNGVKKQYMQLQHEFPGIVVNFEPMPDPAKCGKRREGFFNYQQQLQTWQDNALQQINNARETSTTVLVGGAVELVNKNADQNAAMNAAITVATGEAVMDNVNTNAAAISDSVKNEGAKTRRAVHSEGSATRRAVHSEGAATRQAVHQEGIATRDAIQVEGAKTRQTVSEEGATTRGTVRSEGAKTRKEIQAQADRVIDTLDPVGINRAIKSVRDMAAKAGKSIGEFITQNPELPVPTLEIPLWAARKLIAQM